jgi:hypothetical protein
MQGEVDGSCEFPNAAFFPFFEAQRLLSLKSKIVKNDQHHQGRKKLELKVIK